MCASRAACLLVLLGYGGCQVIDKWNADFSGHVFGPYTTADEVASLAPSMPAAGPSATPSSSNG